MSVVEISTRVAAFQVTNFRIRTTDRDLKQAAAPKEVTERS